MTEPIEAPVVVPAAPPAANGPGARARFSAGLFAESPTYRQLLGMCSTLAVTTTFSGALGMALATTAVLLASSVAISLVRHRLAPHLRILVYTVVMAAFVTVIDRALAAFAPDLSARLGPYVPLIIVNCIIIARAEQCASKQGPLVAAADALGQGGGYTLGILSIALVRELLASGSLAGVVVLPEAWPRLLIMALPPGAFFTLGLLIALSNHAGAVRARARAAASHGPAPAPALSDAQAPPGGTIDV